VSEPSRVHQLRAVEFVRLGYHDASQNFTTPCRDLGEFHLMLLAAGGYNDFDPETVFRALAPLFDEFDSIEFGREASPVLYVHLPYWEHQKIKNRGKTEAETGSHRLTAQELDSLADSTMSTLRKAKADELGFIDFVGSGQYDTRRGDKTRIRAWWD